MGPGWGAWMAALGAAPKAERAQLIVEALRSPEGEGWRRQAAQLVGVWAPVESLVPESAARWRPLVADALGFIFSRLSEERLAEKLAEQMELPANTAPERRLMRLIAKMPGLQKIGQVLARNRRLPPRLRTELTALENGMSDVTAPEMRRIVEADLGERLERYEVEVERGILSEASVSAVLRFTWRRPGRERERGVFKVQKPYVAEYYAEDMRLLQALGNYVAASERGYGFAARDIDEMITEVRILLERELDFRREQATLAQAARTYRSSLGVRAPRVFPPLSTERITAMSEEEGVKVTDAARGSMARRRRVAEQIVQALVAIPLLSSREEAIFHADPHAGNLLYDEPNRELIVLDWALAESLDRESRRRLVMLAVMMALANREGVRKAVKELRRPKGRKREAERIIDRKVDEFFDGLPASSQPGVLDAMRLLDEIALEGVAFAAPLFLFRKSLFTLDGVLEDVAGEPVRIDYAIARHFLIRWAGSFGLFYAPLGIGDFLKLEWNTLLYPGRAWRRRRGASAPRGRARRTR